MAYKILKYDPYLAPYEGDINLRMEHYFDKKKHLVGEGETLGGVMRDYLKFGFHFENGGFVYREWAPAADALYLTGDFASWDLTAYEMTRLENGVFELRLDGECAPKLGQFVQTVVKKNGALLRRISPYATRVVQDPDTHLWCAQLEDTLANYTWQSDRVRMPETPFIYECHIGMALEEGRVGTYDEFRENVLPRVVALGYNTLQIMAVMEHPYYGSFGYQVSNFYAPSSRFGDSAALKRLVDEAHKNGIAVLLDVVHSHAVKNIGEGLNYFDGSDTQYFHAGARGHHPAWDTKLFDYGKPEVMRFLLSNLTYWLEVFHFDGFRFDGVTSMLYLDHGLGSAFMNYGMYFSENTDTDAVSYLMLANDLIHELKPDAITIAEDMSGMPGTCLPIKEGGLGFDFRLSMGVPDLYIKLLKEYRDEDWDMGMLWYELNNSRPREKRIGYAESHDQALVGDKTIMFRLCDAAMYTEMNKGSNDPVIHRGLALHKMIRILTASLAGEGYLNFMGNEFGHPEWIDFPREGNGWSHHYCRRQWSLADNELLHYGELREFDRAMVALLKKYKTLTKEKEETWCHNQDKILIYAVGELVFAFNFHPTKSFSSYPIPVKKKGRYEVVLTSDSPEFGGDGRVDTSYVYTSEKIFCGEGFTCYLPSRTVTVFRKKKSRTIKSKTE